MLTPGQDLGLERIEAIASELHPDHWPEWMRRLAARICARDPWMTIEVTHPRTGKRLRFRQTTSLAMACCGVQTIGRRPVDRHRAAVREHAASRIREAVRSAW